MRPEKLFLLDIVDAAAAIGRFCESVSDEEFFRDELRQSAVLQKLIVIGETAARLPGEFRERHHDIEWEDIVGFRNIADNTFYLEYFDDRTASFNRPNRLFGSKFRHT